MLSGSCAEGRLPPPPISNVHDLRHGKGALEQAAAPVSHGSCREARDLSRCAGRLFDHAAGAGPPSRSKDEQCRLSDIQRRCDLRTAKDYRLSDTRRAVLASSRSHQCFSIEGSIPTYAGWAILGARPCSSRNAGSKSPVATRRSQLSMVTVPPRKSTIDRSRSSFMVRLT
jgi:hypothetical protein